MRYNFVLIRSMHAYCPAVLEGLGAFKLQEGGTNKRGGGGLCKAEGGEL